MQTSRANHREPDRRTINKVLSAIFCILIVVAIFGSIHFFHPRTLRDVVPYFSSITNVEVVEWTGASDAEYSTTNDNLQNLLEFLGDVRIRRVMNSPVEFPLLVKESYRISGGNQDGVSLLDCTLYDGYVLLDSNKCYKVISPSSFVDIHKMFNVE